MEGDMMKYLNARGIEVINRQKPLEITNSEELLAEVAGIWRTSKEALKAVIQARCDIITNKLIFESLPYETVILRQALLELSGILEDFENIFQEFNNREKSREGN